MRDVRRILRVSNAVFFETIHHIIKMRRNREREREEERERERERDREEEKRERFLKKFVKSKVAF